ncbi:MAG: OmpH family outer membrane protein [Weeksellaceae bacterium]|jgi:outer membrane protein|nr:OmpH family outer membrane protein [Weeksellaceae bacterium]
MRKLTLLSIFAFLFIGSIQLSAQDFGVVSIEEVLNNYPPKVSADAELDAMVKAHQTKMQEKQNAMQAIETEVRTKTEGKSQAEIQAILPELEAKQQDYMNKQQELVDYQQAAAKEVAEREEALMTPIETSIRNSIKKVADAKGLKYVIEKSQLLYSNGVDITAEVRKDLGIN